MSNAVRRVVRAERTGSGDGKSKPDWRKEWARFLKSDQMPSCPVCKGEIEARLHPGCQAGSETFFCEKDCGQIPVGWIDQSESKTDVLELMLKWNPKLLSEMEKHTKGSSTVKKIVSKKIEKAAGKRGGRGRTTGKGITATVEEAFKRATTEKWSDDKILSWLQSEFPGKVHKKLTLEGVDKQRKRYNHGSMSSQEAPPAKPCPRWVKGVAEWRKTGVKGKATAVKDAKTHEPKPKASAKKTVVVRRMSKVS